MFSGKSHEQNITDSEAYKARLNFGAEKEKQIMNEIRSSNSGKKMSQVFETNLLGGYFNISFKKN
ncbi:hypothetical protein CANARDRAFT_28009 [[Candida] arabinofermentans NRRL YB-2248]|uniref:Uncharacterized protein n=1 Tax=[Candida] arabinofermentans NRRL YB-2248 TaxID=983967 RepID=A0A1E4T2H3_9ASCO|nr:hypothetical protein CANARDRAFT_28009 [[Candida] arabinofermentans NRRL YB-2248]